MVVMDRYSRKILSWKLSNTLDSEIYVDALQEVVRQYGKPKIVNTDQGAQFSSEVMTKVLKAAEIRNSMDSKGRWVDNASCGEALVGPGI